VPDIFLLSPAHCGGRRAQLLLREHSTMPAAALLRAGGLTLGAAFAFMSALYFRGKLTYASAFSTPLGRTYVITPTRGLQPPDLPVTADLLREFAAVDVSQDDARYRTAIERDVEDLGRRLPPDARVILLGSIATGKYIDVLLPLLGDRLHVPSAFVGLGDMSRGGLLLRSTRTGCELEYVTAAGVRTAGPPATRAARSTGRRGSRGGRAGSSPARRRRSTRATP
jgi:hypothetical protein